MLVVGVHGVMATLLCAVAVAVAGCTGQINGPTEKRSRNPPSGAETAELPDGTKTAALIPARVRRLTNAEFDASASSLLGTPLSLSKSFPPDTRQSGFTVNDAQRVDPVLAKQLSSAAKSAAAEIKNKLAQLAPCADPVGLADGCAKEFISSFGVRAYRRALDTAESDALFKVYEVGARGASYADGIELVARAVLQSAGFLYVTELGNGNGQGNTELTADELAISLAYLTTGAPPDEELRAAAAQGVLSSVEGREAEARRLLQSPAGRGRITRILREWLELDRIESTAKDSTVYPEFESAKASIVSETDTFIAEILERSTGTVAELLGADWTIADEPLAKLYGAAGTGRVSLTGRAGILNRAAFLAVHAHASESAPVLRGVSVLRRVACVELEAPTTLNVQIVPPMPDPSKTTRERFAIHSQDRECVSCHDSIDAIGFSFEHFDGMGAFRDVDQNKPVDSNVIVEIGKDFDGSYTDSNALAAALASSAEVRACFARHVFRALTARSDDAVLDGEEAFVKFWEESGAQGNIVETLVSYVKSTLFTHRRTQ